jgi:3-phytase
LIGLVLYLLTGGAYALDILLTNDDGYEAEGVNIMFAELAAAGHKVTMVAPKHNNSGRGMGVNTRVFQPVEAVQVGAQKWYVDGTPVDSVQFGLDIVFATAPPDLVVSGTNFGVNPGLGVGMSGTVGAAQNALLRGIPAIAVSAGENQRDKAAVRGAFDDAARFTVQVIAQISLPESDQKIALPPGIGLNINYPGREAKDVTGVAVTRLSSYAINPFSYKHMQDGSYMAVVKPFDGEPTAEQLQEDWHLLQQGYVTITPLDPNLNAAAPAQNAVEKLLGSELGP